LHFLYLFKYYDILLEILFQSKTILVKYLFKISKLMCLIYKQLMFLYDLLLSMFKYS